MTITFAKPSTGYSVPDRQAGGDNKVPRDGNERPRIRLRCDAPGCESGRIPSEKRPGSTIKCKKCGGKSGELEIPPGEVLRSYSRVTSYIDVLEDKSNIAAWDMRNVLIGVAVDPDLLRDVLSKDPENKDDKDWLNRRAQIAKDKAGANEKADTGTYKHALSELVDLGEDLPTDITFEDIMDMEVYRDRTKFFSIAHMEELVVLDELKVAGTPDRVSSWACYLVDGKLVRIDNPGPEHAHMYVPLVAPDGTVIQPEDKLITDLKTGTVEYGGLKMDMQLSIYSRGKLYRHAPDGKYEAETFEQCRTPLENVRQDWGIIMNLPANSGELEFYWADLTLGWRAVQLAGQVREMRNLSRKALTRFDLPTGLDKSA